jgi:hypothetical protein
MEVSIRGWNYSRKAFLKKVNWEKEGSVAKQHIPKIGILWRANVHLGPSFQHLAPVQLVTRIAMGIEDDADPQGS